MTVIADVGEILRNHRERLQEELAMTERAIASLAVVGDSEMPTTDGLRVVS